MKEYKECIYSVTKRRIQCADQKETDKFEFEEVLDELKAFLKKIDQFSFPVKNNISLNFIALFKITIPI